MTGRMTGVVAALVLVVVATARAQTVVDGDTITWQDKPAHLWGIDAPERGQTCADGWPAGQIAADYLTGLIRGRKLECQPKSAATAGGRAAAQCKVDGQDLSAAMAAAGMAWAYTEETRDYTLQDSQAMIQVLGVHAHDCMKAWEWRTRGERPR